jgi:hypothetical protein
MGSGFKRRHKRGTSAESLDSSDEAHIASSASASSKSLTRKKRQDRGVEDYTPQRERASTYTTTGSSTKRKPRVRRSATPDVRYEPPTEQFTPPRVVLQTPSSTISSHSRNARPSSSTRLKSSVARTAVKVKPERLTSPFPLPPLDLSRPLPPPSPTDDPLLLVGPPAIVRRSATPSVVSNKTLVDIFVGVGGGIIRDDVGSPVPIPPEIVPDDQSLWNIGLDLMDETALLGVAFDGPSTFNATFESDDSDAGHCINSDAVDSRPQSAPPPVSTPVAFDPNQSTGSHIFHSDDENADAGEDEGEFTGRFKFYSVPVKHDPPSSATRARRENWGRPVSPFPFAKRSSGPPPHDVAIRGLRVIFDEDSPPPSPSAGRRRSVLPPPGTEKTHWSALEVSGEAPCTRGFTVSEMEARLESRVAQGKMKDAQVSSQPADPTHHMHNWEGCSYDNNEDEDIGSVERQITPVDDLGQTTLDDKTQMLGATKASPEYSIHPPEHLSDQQTHLDVGYQGQQGALVDEREESVIQDHSLESQHACDDDDGSHDNESPPHGVVEVSSDDPKAAARAAAILKLVRAHDYFTWLLSLPLSLAPLLHRRWTRLTTRSPPLLSRLRTSVPLYV